MTIGIDIRMLANKRKSGIEEYTENLLSHMLFIDTSIKFKLFYSSFRDHIGDYSWLNLPNVDLVDYKIPNNLLFGSARVFNWPFMDELMDGADVFFSPHFFLAPLSKGCKRVTTIHDLSFASFPEYFSARQNIWHRIEMSPSKQFKSSDKIIAVSKSTKDDLASKYDIDPARINVVHSGISDNIARPTDENLEKFRLNKGLPEKFILFLGKLEPRKNVVALIRAFNMLKLQTGFEDLNLVIAGTKGWLSQSIFKEVAASPYKSQIVLTGHVVDDDRSFYYSLASVFVYPSLFEGFGFPPLEAMRCGTPVVVSNNSSLPEVAGDASIMVDPRSVDEVAFSVRQVLVDRELRASLVELGAKRAAQFTWQKAAEETLDIIIHA